MKITFSPQARFDKLAIHRAGDVLAIAGTALDFADLPEGATLPREAVPSPWLASDVTRAAGDLQMTLIKPVDAQGNDDDPLIEDGIPEGTPVGIIDWTRLVTAADKSGTEMADLIAAIKSERDRRITALAAGYTETERETWHVQVSEARALADDSEAPAPMLRGIAERRGAPVLELAHHVLGLSADYAQKTGRIMGSASVLRGMDPIPEDLADDKWWE